MQVKDMGNLSKKLVKTYKKVGKFDGKTLHEGMEKLTTRRDELLQEVLEAQNKLAELERQSDAESTKLKRCLTQIVLCEKMMQNFGVDLDKTRTEILQREKERDAYSQDGGFRAFKARLDSKMKVN